MTRRFMLALLVFGLTVASAAAHDEYRIIGTIAKLGKRTIAVKQTKDGRVFSMDLKDYTLVTRDKKKVDAAELKVGMNVVVDARAIPSMTSRSMKSGSCRPRRNSHAIVSVLPHR